VTSVTDPRSILINPRRAAAFGAIIISGLLLLQYAHRRKPFILTWALGWLLIAPAMLLVARDYVVRYGGDEFLVMITCAAEEARRKAAALKAAFDAAPEAASLPPGIGLSVGAIEVPEGTTDLMPLVREADRRMYEDKGGDR
jgi:predicted signal transduction protein with EAL and GGDEF domain